MGPRLVRGGRRAVAADVLTMWSAEALLGRDTSEIPPPTVNATWGVSFSDSAKAVWAPGGATVSQRMPASSLSCRFSQPSTPT